MNFKHQILAVVICLTIVLFQPIIAIALDAREISGIARDITVKIISESANDRSGVIFDRQDNTYSVITTAPINYSPILRGENLQIITPDGQTYQATSQQKLSSVDLKVLTFESFYEYGVANLGNSDDIVPLQTIFVSGFPTIQDVLDLVSGQIRSIRENILVNPEEDEGYALVYSNQTLPGSSGGAVIDEKGNLIAINGEAIRDSTTGRDISRGIPVNLFLSALEEYERANLPDEEKRLILENKLFANSNDRLSLNESAENTTVKITGYGNGSGVIFMREGDIYSVVTNQHVTPIETDYEVKTYDNIRHKVTNRQEIPDLDLAVVQFSSTEDYYTANLGNSEELERVQPIYIAAFRGEKNDVSVIPGEITSISQDIIQNPVTDKGYALEYTNDTFGGTSGGAILDENGVLMGINGEADVDLKTNRSISRGIPINLFIDGWIELNLRSN